MLGNTDKPIERQKDDTFGIERYVNGLSTFILNSDTPMTISIQGDWGSGKTSMMNMIQEKISRDTYTIWFNTWQFSQFELQNELTLSMLYYLLSQLDYDSEGLKKIVTALGGAMRLATGFAAEKVLGGAAAGEILSNMNSASRDYPTEIRKLKSKFQELINDKLAKTKKDRVVIFIDDLDRLQPQKAVELLEVLKVFLDCENCVYVLAVDYEIVTQGIKEKFGDDFSQWPFRLVSRDWVIQAPDHVIVPANQDGVVDPGLENEDCEEEVADQDNLVVPSDAIDIADSVHALTPEDMSLMGNIPEHMKRKKRYLTLYHLAKCVVSIASRDSRNSSKLFAELSSIKRDLLALPSTEVTEVKEFTEDSEAEEIIPEESVIHETAEIVDVIDSAGRRRGRKKKSMNEQRRKLRRATKETCQLCGQAHDLTKCHRYRDFRTAITHNQNQPDEEGKRRCRMCFGIGHNTKTCPWIAANNKRKTH